MALESSHEGRWTVNPSNRQEPNPLKRQKQGAERRQRKLSLHFLLTGRFQVHCMALFNRVKSLVCVGWSSLPSHTTLPHSYPDCHEQPLPAGLSRCRSDRKRIVSVVSDRFRRRFFTSDPPSCFQEAPPHTPAHLQCLSTECGPSGAPNTPGLRPYCSVRRGMKLWPPCPAHKPHPHTTSSPPASTLIFRLMSHCATIPWMCLGAEESPNCCAAQENERAQGPLCSGMVVGENAQNWAKIGRWASPAAPKLVAVSVAALTLPPCRKGPFG